MVNWDYLSNVKADLQDHLNSHNCEVYHNSSIKSEAQDDPIPDGLKIEIKARAHTGTLLRLCLFLSCTKREYHSLYITLKAQ